MPTWRRTELKPGTYDEIVTARLERQLAALGPHFEVHRKAIGNTEAIGAVVESLVGEALALALTELKSDPSAAIALAEQVLAVFRSRVREAFSRDDELHLRPERLLAVAQRPAAIPERPRGSLVDTQNRPLMDT